MRSSARECVTNPHAKIMSAVTQASAQVAKTVAVSTGKVSNAKSMMVWRPHGNKYVSFDASERASDRAMGDARAAYLCGAMG